MRALDVATKFENLKICERNNGWRLKKYEKQLKQRKHCKKHCILVVRLEKVVLREGNCRGNRKLGADPAQHFARAIQRRNLKQTWLNLGNDDSISFGHRLNNSLNCLAGL